MILLSTNKTFIKTP